MGVRDWCINKFDKIKNKIIDIWNDRSHLFWYILLLYGVAIAFTFTTLIGNSLTLPLAGDYVLQQIPFYTNGYDDWMTFFKTGEFPFWDHNTFLGANNIGSNAFYYVMNPFFFPILLWPRDYIAQGLAFLMLTKLVLAGLSFRYFLKYIGLKESTARLFGLAYAFCGWNLYYFWFNHFLEVCVVFPLVLLGIEKLIKEKRPWVLMGSLGLMGLCNFFFLVSTCFAGVAYAIYRYFSEWKNKTPKDRTLIIGIGVGSFLVGIMIGALTLLPALPVVLESPRVETASFLDSLKEVLEKIIKEGLSKEELTKLWKLISTFEQPKQAYYPLMSFLFPSISGYSAVLFNNYGYDNTLSSIFIFTPLMMFLVPSLLNAIRKKRIKNLVAFALLMFALFTPFFYYLSYGFTLAYGRWEILAVACALIFIGKNFEEKDEMPRCFFDISFGVVAIGVIIAVSFAVSIQNDFSGSYVYPLGDRVYVIIGQCIYIVVCYGFLRFNHRRKDLVRILTGVVAIEAIVMGTLTFNYQPPSDYSTLYGGLPVVMEEEAIIESLQEQDNGYYRIFNTNADRHSNNLQMREGYNGVAAFHSLYNYNVFDFVQWSRIGYSYSNWSMGVHEKRYNLDEFLNIKYYIQRGDWSDLTKIKTWNNIPHGFVEMEELSTNSHKVYKNTNFIELGFAFDSLMLSDEVDSVESESIYYSSLNRKINEVEAAYLSSAIIYEEDLESIQKEISLPVLSLNQAVKSTLHSVSSSLEMTFPREEEQYRKYVEEVRSIYPNYSDEEIKAYIKSNMGFDYDLYSNPIKYESNNYSSITKYTYGSQFEITPKNRVCSSRGSENKEDDYCYISLNLRMGENANVEMFDTNGNSIAFDNHMYHYYDNSGDWKSTRGFYVKDEVEKIVVTMFSDYNNSKRSLPYPYIHYEYYSDYKERINKLKANEFENIEVRDNAIDFETNYDNQKMIVLSIPFDSGWSGTYIDDNGIETPINFYKAQGGFLSFASKVGQTHYKIRYSTPLLKEGLLLFVSGLTIMASTWGAVYIFEHKRKKEMEIVDE